MGFWGGYPKLVFVTIFMLNVLFENTEARSFGRRHQVKVLAQTDGEQDVQPMSNPDGPSLPSSENQQSTETISNDKEKEFLSLTKSQETSRFSRERLSPRLRPSCASDVFQPEKRLTEETPKLAKLQEETAKVTKVENTEGETEPPEIPQRKLKKIQKIRRQQKVNINSDPEKTEDDSSTLSKTEQSDLIPALPVELEPVKPAMVDKDVPVIPENEDVALTDSELRKFRRVSRKKSKKVTTTTTTTPPPESMELSEETSEGDENEYVAPISDQDVHLENLDEGTKDEDPGDGPIAKALSDNATDIGSVEKTSETETGGSNEEHQAEEGTPSSSGRKKKNRRAKSRRPLARQNEDSQASYRQSRRRPNYQTEDLEE